VDKAKPFCISKWEVWEAYKRVRANQGGAGVDGQSIAEFEEELKDNLFKIWNRISSGSYFPPPVRRVEIPKDNGEMRPLGIPTVADRIAQTVVKRCLEPILEEHFHPDSYGYRPKKSAIEAIGIARQRCWRSNWILDLDIKGFFDNIDHELLMRAVGKHTDCKWVLLYIARWLKAPVQLEDGNLTRRDKGTPQGGVISPLLANLFLHYAFDTWMQRQNPQIQFERYADDGICHCRSKAEAEGLRVAIERRFAECGLELNLQKTKIVYCKDSNRRGNYPEQKFDFLGYAFRPRIAKERSGQFFVSFIPAISNKASKSLHDTMRRWRLHRRTDKSLDELAQMFNPVLRGWINYYGSFYRSALYRTFQPLNNILAQWATRKYKRLKRHKRRACQWLQCIMHRQPSLFAHWRLSQVKAGQ
jgi:group II intron reverse transcriptase/maturase